MKQHQIYNQYKTARAPSVPSVVIEGNFVSSYRVRESGGKYSTSRKQGGEGANTPSHIVNLVTQVLGAIDLDPCADDGKRIPVCQHYTTAADGLQKQWNGRLFINPPQELPWSVGKKVTRRNSVKQSQRSNCIGRGCH